MELSRLRKKYEFILELRLRRLQSEPAPKDELRALSGEFPGALRDLDALPLAEIHDRIDALVAAELDPARMGPWMIAELSFYGAMRGALAAKGWLKKRRDVDDAVRDAFAREAALLTHGEEAKTWLADLAHVARPPRGRIVQLAFARVARDMSLSPEEVGALVFRHPKALAETLTPDRKAQRTGE